MVGRRVVVRELGESVDDGIARCAIEDQPEPEPAPGEVVVAVRSAQVGWVDLIMTSGQYQHVPERPYTPGMEWAGVVARVGAGVRGLREGDPVLADGLTTGPRSKSAHQRFGGFATWSVAAPEALMPVPEGLDLDQAACLLGSYETAWHVLVTCGRVGPGETVLVLGATGSTGLAAVDVARSRGARVVAAGRSAEKLAEVTTRGADHAVVVGEGDLRAAVKDLTGGRGVDVVYDGVGGPLSVEALRCTAFGARFLLVGWAATPDVSRGRGGRGAPNANQLPTNLMLMKGLQVIGCPTVIATERDPSLRPPRLEAVRALVADGVRPAVARVWSLEGFQEAMRAKRAGALVGGIVLRP